MADARNGSMSHPVTPAAMRKANGMRTDLPTGVVRPQSEGLYDAMREHDACGVGFIVDLKNRPSQKIVQNGLSILENLEHRGAVGADPLMGDGAGIMVQIPHRFFVKESARLGYRLPEAGAYAVGFIFMPQDAELRMKMEKGRRQGYRGRGPDRHRLARRAVRQLVAVEGPGHCRHRALPPAGDHRPRRRHR